MSTPCDKCGFVTNTKPNKPPRCWKCNRRYGRLILSPIITTPIQTACPNCIILGFPACNPCREAAFSTPNFSLAHFNAKPTTKPPTLPNTTEVPNTQQLAP